MLDFAKVFNIDDKFVLAEIAYTSVGDGYIKVSTKSRGHKAYMSLHPEKELINEMYLVYEYLHSNDLEFKIRDFVLCVNKHDLKYPQEFKGDDIWPSATSVIIFIDYHRLKAAA